MPFVGPASRREPYLPGPPPREAGSTKRLYPIEIVRAEERRPKIRGYSWLPGPPPSEDGSTKRLYPIIQTHTADERRPKVSGRVWMGRARREAPVDPNARQHPMRQVRGDDRLPRMRAVRPIWMPWHARDVPPPPTDRPGGWQKVWTVRDPSHRTRVLAYRSGNSKVPGRGQQVTEFPVVGEDGPRPLMLIDWNASRQRRMPKMPSGLSKEAQEYLAVLTQWVRDSLRENQRNWQRLDHSLDNGTIVTNPDPTLGMIVDIRYNQAVGYIQVLYAGASSWTNKIQVRNCS